MEETESVKAKGKQILVATDRCLIGVPDVTGEVFKHVYEMIFEWRTLYVGEMWRAKGVWKIIDEVQGRFCDEVVRSPMSTPNGAPEWECGREGRRNKDALYYSKIPVQDFVNRKRRIAKMLLQMAGRKPEM
jgi:hypothetical protein